MIEAGFGATKNPTQEEFENWIKLATDNKINASNSWDVALIDYFHELSVLRDGEEINFQRASATLDGCVKIYTSRIDSAATETGRLLSGLAFKKDGGVENDEEEDNDDNGGDEENTDNTVATRKVALKGSTSLAKSFKALRSKKIDGEIMLDPLFKKTLTEFDEGGAKSLLMNLLHIDNTGRVLFDTNGSVDFTKAGSTSHSACQDSTRQNPIDLSAIAGIMKPNVGFDQMEVCPSIQTLIKITDSGDTAINLLEQLQQNGDYENEPDDFNMGFDDNNDDGQQLQDGTGSFDFTRLYEEDNGKSEGPNITMVRLFNENFIEEDVEVSHLGEVDLDLMNYFNTLSKKSWAGPEHWKVTNVRKLLQRNEDNDKDNETTDRPHKSSDTGAQKHKEPFKIDFFAKDHETSDEVLFKSSKYLCQPRHQWISDTKHLLPSDQLFSTKNFIYLSLKPTKLINTVLFGNKKKVYKQRSYDDDEAPSFVDENFYAQNFENNQELRNKRLHTVYEGDLAEIHESFGDAGPEPDFGDGDGYWGGSQPPPAGAYGSQLATSLSNFKPNNINFARVAKRVDIRLLKDNLWDSFTKIKSETKPNSQDVEPSSRIPYKFTEVVQDVGQKYTKEQKDELSTSFCFICLLHLANENGLVIENSEDYSDLIIREGA